MTAYGGTLAAQHWGAAWVLGGLGLAFGSVRKRSNGWVSFSMTHGASSHVAFGVQSSSSIGLISPKLAGRGQTHVHIQGAGGSGCRDLENKFNQLTEYGSSLVSFASHAGGFHKF